MTASPVAGSKISIGPAVDPKATDFVAADFTGLTYTEILNWTERGEYGDTSELITEPLIGENRVLKSKGTKNAGTMQNVFVSRRGLPAVNPGLVSVATALLSDQPFAFRIENNDKPAAGAAPKNSFDYFIGLVMAARVTGGGANVNRKVTVIIELASNIVNIPASAT